MTPEQVRAFQRGPEGGPKPIDFFGVPLKVDGDLGPRTRWAMDLATLPAWRQNVVRSALSMVGRREEGVNRGEWIDEMIRRCRLDPDADGKGPSSDGHPWCAAFACWHLAHHSPHAFTPDASVRRLMAQLYPVPWDRALPGDLAGFVRPDGTGHIGILLARGGGWSASVDGNLDNRVRVVRCPTHDRKYVTVERPIDCPDVAGEIPLYTGSTR